MSRKGENIRKRKDGRWEGRYKRGIKENGTIDYGSVYGKTYKEVKEKLTNTRQALRTVDLIPSSEKKFSEVLFLWLETNRIRLKGGSEQRYDYLIQTHILPELGGLKVSQISATKVNTFLMSKLTNGRIDGHGGLSPSYVSSIMIIVNSAISFAVAERMCPPLRTPIYKPQKEKSELEILSHEAQAAIELFINHNLSPTATGVLISLYTGLRIGEVCALAWDDIDIANKVIHVRHTVTRIKSRDQDVATKTVLVLEEPKTKASKRDIPIPAALLPTLTKHKEVSKSKYVVSDGDEFISPRTYEYRYHKMLEQCGVASINYHALRHTFASRCIEVGVDVKSLSEILGHKNSSITLNTYVHSSMAQKRCQLDKLSAVAAI